MPTMELTREIASNTPILDILADAGIVPSKSEGRRLIKQGGIYLNDVAISDANYLLIADNFVDGEAIIRRGKKNFFRLVLV